MVKGCQGCVVLGYVLCIVVGVYWMDGIDHGMGRSKSLRIHMICKVMVVRSYSLGSCTWSLLVFLLLEFKAYLLHLLHYVFG